MTQLPDQLQKSRTNGYSDVLLKIYISASDTSYNYFKFHGNKYKQSKRLVNAHAPATVENPNEQKWQLVACREYYKNFGTR